MYLGTLVFIVLIALVVFILLVSAIKILKEYERGVIFRFGRLKGVKGPGIFLIIPLVDKMVKVDLRIVTLDVPPQDIITKDNVPVKVNAVVYFKVLEPEKSVIAIENYIVGTSQIAQTTLRSIIGQVDLDDLLSKRDKINQELQKIIDDQTDPWGIKVTNVEVRDVILPESMKRAMASQAETERERRAKVINAEGEFQAAEKLAAAAAIISKDPAAIQLRFLQTLTQVATEHNSTTIFPVPIDLFSPFIKGLRDKVGVE